MQLKTPIGKDRDQQTLEASVWFLLLQDPLREAHSLLQCQLQWAQGLHLPLLPPSHALENTYTYTHLKPSSIEKDIGKENWDCKLLCVCGGAGEPLKRLKLETWYSCTHL